MILGPH
ncbi:hypothetical protein LINPERHAP1_LOCUS15145 [Linum perenne]